MAVIAGTLCATACRQDMHNQPRYKPFAATNFFADGRSERPLLENTVAHGAVADDVYSVAKDYPGFPLPVDEKLLRRGEDHAGGCRARPGAVQYLLLALPRAIRRWTRHDCAARAPPASELS